MENKQIIYLFNLLRHYEQLDDTVSMFQFINNSLMSSLPHHTSLQITNLMDLTKLQLSFLINMLVKKHSIPQIKPVKQLNFRFVNIAPHGNYYSIYNQVHDDPAKSPLIILLSTNIMMLDIDSQECLPQFPEQMVFRVYKTFKGYHCYCTSQYSPYNNFQTLALALKLGCDPHYISFVRKCGWKTRISPKKEYQPHDFIERFECTVGDPCKEIPELVDALVEKDFFVNVYRNVDWSGYS